MTAEHSTPPQARTGRREAKARGHKAGDVPGRSTPPGDSEAQEATEVRQEGSEGDGRAAGPEAPSPPHFSGTL